MIFEFFIWILVCSRLFLLLIVVEVDGLWRCFSVLRVVGISFAALAEACRQSKIECLVSLLHVFLPKIRVGNGVFISKLRLLLLFIFAAHLDVFLFNSIIVATLGPWTLILAVIKIILFGSRNILATCLAELKLQAKLLIGWSKDGVSVWSKSEFLQSRQLLGLKHELVVLVGIEVEFELISMIAVSRLVHELLLWKLELLVILVVFFFWAIILAVIIHHPKIKATFCRFWISSFLRLLFCIWITHISKGKLGYDLALGSWWHLETSCGFTELPLDILVFLIVVKCWKLLLLVVVIKGIVWLLKIGPDGSLLIIPRLRGWDPWLFITSTKKLVKLPLFQRI